MRQLFSVCFTLLTLAASIITIVSLFKQPQTEAVAMIAPPSRSVPVQRVDTSLQACVLEKTEVNANVIGYTCRVTVKQIFRNPNKKRFDAVYTFPLSDSAAVDEMEMKIGKRVIRGEIKEKTEARKMYEAAQAAGQTASLLEQHRTNIFTQSIANVDPGESIEVTLKYSDILPFADGKYSLIFPTRVGPRFTPGGSEPVAQESANLAEGTLAFNVNVDAGMPMNSLSANTSVDFLNFSKASPAIGSLAKTNVPHGDDFIVNWEVSTNAIESGVVTHRHGDEGYLTAMLMPPKRVAPREVASRELVFLVDCSGSQAGPPLQKAKETLHYIVDRMNPNDTFQICPFGDTLGSFATEPQPVSYAMKQRAHAYIEKLTADGGTMMVPAVEALCRMPAAANRLRIVTFMTDGYVSNDTEVIGLIKKFRGTSRWFSFGTGNSVNRNLIDCIAKEGGGEAEYIDLNADGNKVAAHFYERISNPVLTDVSIRFEGINVKEVYPKQLSDVWAQKPLYFHGRFEGIGSGTAIVSGYAAGKRYEKRLAISLPLLNTNNQAVEQTWARAKVDDLNSQLLIAANGPERDKLEEAVKQTGLKHHLLTDYTSFIAVNSGAQSTETSVVAPSQDAITTNTLLGPAFSTVVTQLNALNSYSGTGPFPGATNGNIGPQGADAILINGVNTAGALRTNPEDTINFSFVQMAALAIMWLASLQLWFGRKKIRA